MKGAGARALGVVLAISVFAPREAGAMGAVVGPPKEPVSIANARVAVAVAEGRTTRWAQIALSSTPHPAFAWLVPVMPGARVDLTSDAWLDALDASTVPVVLPPSVPSTCDVTLDPQVIAAVTAPSTESPGSARLALDLASLTSFVSASGLVIESDLAANLGDVFASGGEILALVYAGGGSSPVRTLRIVDTGPATLPFALTGNASGPVSVTAFIVAGSEQQAGSSPLVLAPGGLFWLPSGQSSAPGMPRCSSCPPRRRPSALPMSRRWPVASPRSAAGESRGPRR